MSELTCLQFLEMGRHSQASKQQYQKRRQQAKKKLLKLNVPLNSDSQSQIPSQNNSDNQNQVPLPPQEENSQLFISISI